MTATTPTFDDLQKFSKEQLEAYTAASSTLSKGLQDIVAEIDRLFEEGLLGRHRDVREASRRSQRRISSPDSNRIRQAGLRGLCRSGDQGVGALHPSRLRRVEAGHHGLREHPEVNGPSRRRQIRRTNPLPADAGAFQAPAFYFHSLPNASRRRRVFSGGQSRIYQRATEIQKRACAASCRSTL